MTNAARKTTNGSHKILLAAFWIECDCQRKVITTNLIMRARPCKFSVPRTSASYNARTPVFAACLLHPPLSVDAVIAKKTQCDNSPSRFLFHPTRFFLFHPTRFLHPSRFLFRHCAFASTFLLSIQLRLTSFFYA
jgi:hypothetical protein